MEKYAHLVELEKCCQTHIFLQNFVLIEPRTSPLKICKIFNPRLRGERKLIHLQRLASRPAKGSLVDRIRQTLEGSFSAVSKPNFASKYAFESSRRDLHKHSFAQLCNLKFLSEFSRNFAKECIVWISARALQRVFSVYLQNLASIQPRTSPNTFVSSSSRESEFRF